MLDIQKSAMARLRQQRASSEISPLRGHDDDAGDAAAAAAAEADRLYSARPVLGDDDDDDDDDDDYDDDGDGDDGSDGEGSIDSVCSEWLGVKEGAERWTCASIGRVVHIEKSRTTHVHATRAHAVVGCGFVAC